MTLRAKPSRSRSANSMSGAASCGRYLAFGAEREFRHRPEDVAMRVDRARRRRVERLRRASDQLRIRSLTRTPFRPSACARCGASRRWSPCQLRPSPARRSSRRSDARPRASCAAPPGSTATAAAGEPGIRQAVATLTAPSTPIEAWARCGMKERTVDRAAMSGRRRPASSSAPISSATSPRFISGPAFSRIASIRAFSVRISCRASRDPHSRSRRRPRP